MKPNPWIHLWFAMALLFTAALAACDDPDLLCTDPLGCIAIGRNDPIQIAALLAESGSAAPLGLDAATGVEMAIMDRNSELLGHALILTREDSGCTRTRAQTAVARIIASGQYAGIIGPTCTDIAADIAPVVQGAGLVMISPSVAGRVDGIMGSESASFFRTVPPTFMQGDVAAQFAYNWLDARRAAIIGDESEIAADLGEAFAESFTALGGQIVFQGTVSVEQNDLGELIAAVSVGMPDILFLPMFMPEASYLLNRLEERNTLNDLLLIGPETLFNPLFPESTGAAADAMYLVAQALVSEEYQAFLARWRERYGEPPASHYHAYAYDATNVLLDAIVSSTQVGSNGALIIGRQALRESVQAAAGDGLSGPLSCQPSGECATTRSLGIYELGNNEITGRRWPPSLVWKP